VLGTLKAYLDYDKYMGGCAATIWPKLLGMGFKDLFGMPVMVQLSILCEHAIANMESGSSQLRSMVEYSAGFGNLSRSFIRRRFKVASLDKKYHNLHDVLSSEGLRLWLLCLMCCEACSFLWFAPECSSFVTLCAAQALRGVANGFLGDTSKTFVMTGNSLLIVHSMIMAIALALGHQVGLEQPTSSCMLQTAWMSHIISFFKLAKTHTYLGAFGGRTQKPLVPTSSLDLTGMMRDRPVMAETLATKDGDANGFTGKKELLVESEMYTFAFSEALAKIVQAQL